MYGLLETKLQARRDADNPIRVGLVGAGKFGVGLAVQVAAMPGVTIAAVADRDLEHALHAYTACGVVPADVTIAESVAQVDACIDRQTPCVVQDGLALTRSERIELLVEATGSPEAGALLATDAIAQGKHVVMVNVEADVTIGALLRRRADAAGVVYTLVDGDQPGATMNLVNWARLLGFDVIAAGRGTIMRADDREGTPDTVPARFNFTPEQMERRTINTRMYNSFRDGTKAQIEMTALANMAGLVPDVRGMHEPAITLEQIPRLFCHEADGGLLSGEGVVELANSVDTDGVSPLPDSLGMGVFAVIRTDHPYTQEDLLDYMGFAGGNGRTYLLYRPYHLVAVTAPLSILRAVLLHEATGQPLPVPMAETVTAAKRDLAAGTVLDGGGGYTVVGLCERADRACRQNLLPLGLCPGATLKEAVPAGGVIARNMVEMPPATRLHRLRAEQEQILKDEG